eukprot:gb/GECG01014418.1/.p1 GENE.gb/GECG01014418.1/~~gb/GECG01014418.1/.p1  ORF type:complete len:776 (+),score=76.85 gb/GECG01014418.1/:1-2328(+)
MVKFIASEVAYATVFLVFLCYFEYIRDVLRLLKHGNTEGRFLVNADDMLLRKAAVLCLRNGFGEEDVGCRIRNYLYDPGKALFREESVEATEGLPPRRFEIPCREKMHVKFQKCCEEVVQLFEKQPCVIFAVDEAQYLAGVGRGVFCSQTERMELQPHDSFGIQLFQEPDLLYVIQKVCAVDLRGRTRHGPGTSIGTVLLGPHDTFRELIRRGNISSSTHSSLMPIYTLDTFDASRIRELILHYFKVDEIWDRLYSDSTSDFCECIQSLKGRGKWTYFLLSKLHFRAHNWDKSTTELDVEQSLVACAKAARTATERELKGLIAEAFTSQQVVDASGTKLASGVAILYLLICLDAPHVELTMDALESLIGKSVIPVNIENGVANEAGGVILDEPLTKRLIFELGNERLAVSNGFRQLMETLSLKMVINNMYLQAGGLGEDAEGVFCHWVLRRMLERKGKPLQKQAHSTSLQGSISKDESHSWVSLWDLLHPMLKYVETLSKDREPGIRLEGNAVIEELRSVRVKVTTCKNARDHDDGSNKFGEIHWLFEAWNTGPDGTRERQYHFERLLTQLSHEAGFDALMFALRTATGETHSQECAVSFQIKIKKRGSLREAAMTTDPSLQYMTEEQRKAAVIFRPVPGNKSEERTKYDKLRSEMGPNGAFQRTYRFVVGLRFSKDTCKRAVMRFRTSQHPLLVLNLAEAIPDIMKMKERLGGITEDMYNMDEDSSLWTGVREPVFLRITSSGSGAAASTRGDQSTVATRGQTGQSVGKKTKRE